MNITLVLPSGKEVTINELNNIKSKAIDIWLKEDSKISKAIIKKQEADEIIKGCNKRIRMLTLMGKL